jgi:hypothetical protein
MTGLFHLLFLSCNFKTVFFDQIGAISTYFWPKMTQKEFFLRDSQSWELADFFLIEIRDIQITSTNILGGQSL